MREKIELEAVVAVYSDWGIGDGRTQPVTVHADRARFRELTKGAAVICGRRTMEDFPGGKPLKNRVNIILTRQNMEIPGAVTVQSRSEALAAAKQALTGGKAERCFVIGGSSVFEQFYPFLDRAYVTKLDCCPESSCFFHDLDGDPEWQRVESGEPLEENGIGYRFCVYRRINTVDINAYA